MDTDTTCVSAMSHYKSGQFPGTVNEIFRANRPVVTLDALD